MRTYIVLRYLAFAIPIGAVMALATTLMPLPADGEMMPLGDVVAQALFWSTPVATWLTWRDLDRRNVWPLVDNLRVSRVGAIAVPAAAQLLLSMAAGYALP